MATVHEGRIGGQHEAYRKGLVLGLTMAEIAILIIFVLLLLLVFDVLRHADFVDQLNGKSPASLRVRADAFDSIALAFGPMPDDSSRDFVKLVRVMRGALARPRAKGQIAQGNQALTDLKRELAEVQRVASSGTMGGPDSLARRVEQQAFVIANLQGQIKQLQDQLEAAGGPKGQLPSCWAQQGGKIDFVYDVALTSSGIRIRELAYGTRQRERTLITSWVPNPNEVLTEAQFLDFTRPWYSYSQEHDCRFFVVIYDETAAHEKPLYKNLLKTVEGHFYKRLDNGRAPF